MIFAAIPVIFVIGTGYAGNMRVPDDVRSAIENKDIGVITAKTVQAIEIFNRLQAEGKDVAGAFHRAFVAICSPINRDFRFTPTGLSGVGIYAALI